MDKRTDRTVALMSIHPIYAKRLLDGSKRIELRKTKLSSRIEYVVVYATSPVKRIVGYFSVKQIVVDTPTEIWAQYRQVVGIEQREFYLYYRDSVQAVAIEVAQMHLLTIPQPLSIIAHDLRPPQSYQYFDRNLIEVLSPYGAVEQANAA